MPVEQYTGSTSHGDNTHRGAAAHTGKRCVTQPYGPSCFCAWSRRRVRPAKHAQPEHPKQPGCLQVLRGSYAQAASDSLRSQVLFLGALPGRLCPAMGDGLRPPSIAAAINRCREPLASVGMHSCAISPQQACTPTRLHTHTRTNTHLHANAHAHIHHDSEDLFCGSESLLVCMRWEPHRRSTHTIRTWDASRHALQLRAAFVRGTRSAKHASCVMRHVSQGLLCSSG